MCRKKWIINGRAKKNCVRVNKNQDHVRSSMIHFSKRNEGRHANVLVFVRFVAPNIPISALEDNGLPNLTTIPPNSSMKENI